MKPTNHEIEHDQNSCEDVSVSENENAEIINCMTLHIVYFEEKQTHKVLFGKIPSLGEALLG